MMTTTDPTPRASAREGDMPRSSSQAVSRAPSVAPENAPDKTPTSVIPIWTVERKRPGFSPSAIAMLAPRLPLSARTLNLAGREETTASSDIARTPLSSVSSTTMIISKYNIVPQIIGHERRLKPPTGYQWPNSQISYFK